MAPPHKIDALSLNDASTSVSFLSLTASALTKAMRESVPFFFCSDFGEEIFVDLKWKDFWQWQYLNPQPSDLIHNELDHRTTVSCLNTLFLTHLKVWQSHKRKVIHIHSSVCLQKPKTGLINSLMNAVYTHLYWHI